MYFSFKIVDCIYVSCLLEYTFLHSIHLIIESAMTNNASSYVEIYRICIDIMMW